MIAIIWLLVILVFSLLNTRTASIALTFTGLSRQAAKFQARSAFTGVGFTTSESEKIVNHPVRRKILMLIMLIGNAGVVATISTFILGFIKTAGDGSVYIRILVLIAGIALLLCLSMSEWLEQRLTRLIARALKRYTALDVKDYASILHLSGDYYIHELYVKSKDWLANQNLEELQLTNEGILVLGITRKDGSFIGTPRKDTRVEASDTLILYGRDSNIARLDQRQKGPGGNIQHSEAVAREKIRSDDA